MIKSETKDLSSIVGQLSEELLVDVCSLYVTTPDNHLELAATFGLSQNAIGARMSFNQGLTGRVARTQHSLSVKNPDTHPDYYHINSSGEEKYQSYLGIPLIRHERLLGVLVVQTIRPKMFFMSEIKSLYDAGRKLMDVMESELSLNATEAANYRRLA